LHGRIGRYIDRPSAAREAQQIRRNATGVRHFGCSLHCTQSCLTSGALIRIHGQEFNSFRRKTRSKTLREFKLRRQEKFLYICDTLHMWEWDIRVVDIDVNFPLSVDWPKLQVVEAVGLSQNAVIRMK